MLVSLLCVTMIPHVVISAMHVSFIAFCAKQYHCSYLASRIKIHHIHMNLTLSLVDQSSVAWFRIQWRSKAAFKLNLLCLYAWWDLGLTCRQNSMLGVWDGVNNATIACDKKIPN